jgi:hypothetical protein
MSRKERMTVTVDRELVEAGSAAVAAGNAESLSGWVNLAMAERAEKELRLRAMASAVALYEAEFGVMSSAELTAQQRADRRTAVIVRGTHKPKVRGPSRRKR